MQVCREMKKVSERSLNTHTYTVDSTLTHSAPSLSPHVIQRLRQHQKRSQRVPFSASFDTFCIVFSVALSTSLIVIECNCIELFNEHKSSAYYTHSAHFHTKPCGRKKVRHSIDAFACISPYPSVISSSITRHSLSLT